MDLNMLTAYRIASILFHASSRPMALPTSLQEILIRTRLINEVNIIILYYVNSIPTPDVLRGQIIAFPEPVLNGMLCQIADQARNIVTELVDDNVRTGVMLCMWSGCLEGAKTIASRTNDEENTPEIRNSNCRNHIDIISSTDLMYRSGVEAAPVWKRLIGQSNDIYFDGVPDNSPLTLYRDVIPQNEQ